MTQGTSLHLSVAELHAGYLAGDLDPVRVVDEALDRVEEVGQLGGWATPTPDRARREALAARQAMAAARDGAPLPKLTGVPVSVKDVFPVAGVVTRYGSAATPEIVNSSDGALVARLVEAGAVIVGTTSTPEFAQSATTEHRLGPPAANPWDPALTAGGSSGGAAVTVTVGAAMVAVGSDAGGSVRIPAALTGLTGLKPTQGWGHDPDGLQAMTPFSTPGPLAHRAADARVLAEVLQATELRPGPSRRLRIGVCPQPREVPIEHPQREAVTTAGHLLAEVHELVELELDLTGWFEAFGPQVVAEEHRRRGHLLREMPELLTDYEKATLRAGKRVTPDQVVAARQYQLAWTRRFMDQLDDVDALLLPATATVAFPFGTRPTTIDGQPVDALWGAFPTTACFNVAGMPAGVTQVGWYDGLPVAVQVAARPGRDALVLDLCDQLEQAQPGHPRVYDGPGAGNRLRTNRNDHHGSH